MKTPNKLPTASYLRSIFVYDENTGVLIWKNRPIEHFNDVNRFNAFNGKHAGNIAGNIHKNGYVRVSIDGAQYLAHRIIYKMKTGDEPNGEIDHRDTYKSNNRWGNIRLSTKSQNQHNTGIRKDNSTGYKGVHKVGKRFSAVVKLNNVIVFREIFDTPEEAYAARCKAAKKLHKRFVRNGSTIKDDPNSLSIQEYEILRKIERFTQAPKNERFGYKKRWSPKTSEKLYEKGLVEYKFNSVILTGKGRDRISNNSTQQ